MSSTSYQGGFGGDGLVELYWITMPGESTGGSTSGSLVLLVDSGIINRDYVGPYPYSTGTWWGSSEESPLAAHVSIFVAGQEFPFLDNTLRVDQSIGSRGVGNFQIWDRNSTWRFSVGENIDVYTEGILVWKGVINNITRKIPTSSGIIHIIQGTDWTYGADKRRAVMSFPNINPTSTAYAIEEYLPPSLIGGPAHWEITGYTSILTAGYIVHKLTSQYLSEEGIIPTVISTGAVINSAAFNYIKPSQILDVLSEQSGYIWQINPDKTLEFKPHDLDDAEFSLGTSQMKQDSITYKEGSPLYRNVQYVVGGMNITTTQDEYEQGDGKKKTFVVQYPIMQVPTVWAGALATTTRSVGILGVDTTCEYYWNKFSDTITQSSDGSALTTAQSIHIQYKGGFPAIARTEDSEAISALKTNEGGSGVVEDAIYKNLDTMYDDNKTVANNLIVKYSTITDTLSFKTMRPGIRPGTILNITIPDFQIYEDPYLIDRVGMSDVDGMYLWYDVTALSGYNHGGWSNFFNVIVNNTIEKDIWEGASMGDILEFMTAISHQIILSSTFAPSVYVCVVPNAGVFPSLTTIYPC